MKNKIKLLIAGGTGFIGYHLAKKAIKKGYTVTSLSSKKPNKYRRLTSLKYIICSTLNQKLLKKKLNRDFDIVINLSGYVNHREKKKTFSSHYMGCKNLANVFLNRKIKSFIQVGSGMENGNTKSPQKEKIICKPITNYALAKYKASSYLLKLFKKKHFPIIILRLYQAYGPKQDFNRLISTTISKSLNNEKIPCTTGNQKRDFLFIDDLTEIILKFANLKLTKERIFNIGTTQPIKIKNVIKMIVSIIGKGEPQYGKIKLKKGEILNMFPDTTKMKKILKWKPTVSLLKGLKITIRSYKNEIKQ